MVLYKHQKDAIEKMHNGCILCGGVGTGKSLTSIAYFYTKVCNGSIEPKFKEPTIYKDLYIITTAKKRDSMEWLLEFGKIGINIKTVKFNIVVDSWNNISKYEKVNNAFFIFDEQKVCGTGTWSKKFISISKRNKWILLSATPGDTWTDYISVFIANGFYRNKSQFLKEHCVFSKWSKFPKIERYIDCDKLSRLRNKILIPMYFKKPTIPHNINVECEYDKELYSKVANDRWNPYKEEPVMNPSELCYTLRKVVNSDVDRQIKFMSLLNDHPKAIVFYNFDYELDIIKKLLKDSKWQIGEWNGHKHEPIPTSEKWVYLVNYMSGSEGWNCIDTDTIIFYSQTYSYKTKEQASGRIDRLNTPFTDLYYYNLKSKSKMDIAIYSCLVQKKLFNEKSFVEEGDLN